MSGATQARVALAAFVATMLAALTLAPLIQGLAWLVATFVVVALAAGVGASMRQVTTNAFLVTAAELAMLMITLTALFARDAAVFGVLPGPEALDTLRGLVVQGLDVTRHDSPPVDATRGLLLLTAGGVGMVGLVVDLIAVTLRRPAAAGLPLLAVYCVPAAVLPGGLPWVYFLLCGAGYLVLVGADAGDRIRSWGRVLSGAPGERDAGLGGPLSGARRVAATCLVIAVAAPALVPGLSGRLLAKGSGNGSGQGRGGTISVINPILNLRADLGSRSNTPVIRYSSDVPSPQPLRIVTDDQFTGELWQPTTGSLARSQNVVNGLPNPPGLSPTVPTTRHTSRITVGDLPETYLPLPYPTIKVSGIKGLWLWDARTLNVVGDGTTAKNLDYTATYLTVTPTPQQLAAVGPPPADVLQRYGGLPKDLPPRIARTARDVAGRGSAWDQAVRMQAWFRNGGGFTYSEKAPGNGRTDSGQNAVDAFLQNRTGYCVQFASAMAVMARSLRIPARVAVGFLPGSTTDGKNYTITLRDAHAWPELYFEGIGWIRFEPTPATRTGAPPAWTLPPQATEPTPRTSTSASAAPSPQPSARTRPDAPDPTTGTSAGSSGLLDRLKAIPWRVVAVVTLVLLFLAMPRLATALGRRRRWRRAGAPAQRAEAAWEELRESLQDLGVGWAASWTPRALQLRLIGERGLDPEQQAAMARLVTDLEHARYAPPGAAVRPTDALRDDVRTVVSAVAASVAPRVRRRAALMPASGLAAITGLVRNVDAAASQAGARASSLGAQVRRTVGAGSRGKGD